MDTAENGLRKNVKSVPAKKVPMVIRSDAAICRAADRRAATLAPRRQGAEVPARHEAVRGRFARIAANSWQILSNFRSFSVVSARWKVLGDSS